MKKADYIADQLRRKIYSGELISGSQIPTVLELTREYDISNMTIQNGLKTLKKEGLIESRGKKGLFVVLKEKKSDKELYSLKDLKGIHISTPLETRLRVIIQEDLPYQKLCWRKIALSFERHHKNCALQLQFAREVPEKKLTNMDVVIANDRTVLEQLIHNVDPVTEFLPVSCSVPLVIINASCYKSGWSPDKPPTMDRLINDLPLNKYSYIIYLFNFVLMLEYETRKIKGNKLENLSFTFVHKLLKKIKTWYDSGRVRPFETRMELIDHLSPFLNGEVPAIMLSSAYVPYSLAHTEFDTRIIVCPWLPGKPRGLMAASLKNSVIPSLSREFIQFLGGSEAQGLIASAGGNLPVRNNFKINTLNVHEDYKIILENLHYDSLEPYSPFDGLNHEMNHIMVELSHGRLTPEQGAEILVNKRQTMAIGSKNKEKTK